MDIPSIEKRLGAVFQNKDLLREALTHPSFTNDREGRGLPHYERLEFLGDAVLDLIVAEHLMKRFPEKNEGELTTMRSFAVSGANATEAAQRLGIGDYLLIGKTHQAHEQRTPRVLKVILSNAFEAVIGAIYSDQGYEAARSFVERTLLSKIVLDKDTERLAGPKNNFQEKAQERFGVDPTYRVLAETGPDNNKRFVVGTYIKDKFIAQGMGKSKKEAEEDAAQNAIKFIWGSE
jgi:ribonuclease III